MNGPMLTGFSQRIQLDWLELTAWLLLRGRRSGEIQAVLHKMLHGRLSVGEPLNEAIEKMPSRFYSRSIAPRPPLRGVGF
jgi:hypothetical protein